MRNLLRSRRGSAALEFGMCAPVLFAIFAGTFQYGYSMYVYNNLMNSVVDGAHYAATVDFDTAHTFVTPVKNMVLYGNRTGGTMPIVPGLTAANIEILWSTDSAGIPQTITVRIVNLAVNSVFQTFNFNGKPTCTVKFMGTVMLG